MNNVLLSAWNKAKLVSYIEQENTQLKRTLQAIQSDLLKINKELEFNKKVAVWGELIA